MSKPEHSLFMQGYRIAPLWIPIHREEGDEDYSPNGTEDAGATITSPEGKKYIVNAREETCSCPGFANRQRCKHRKGFVQLLIDQAAYWAEQRRLLLPIEITRYISEMLHKGGDPKIYLPHDRYWNYIRMVELEKAEWGCLSLAANMKGHDWAMPAKFTTPEEEKTDEPTL
jgi:hypothetical protein